MIAITEIIKIAFAAREEKNHQNANRPMYLRHLRIPLSKSNTGVSRGKHYLKHNKLNIVGIRLSRLNETCERNGEKHLPAVQVQEYLINVVPLIEHVPLLAQGTSLHTVSGNMSTGSVIDVKWKH